MARALVLLGPILEFPTSPEVGTINHERRDERASFVFVISCGILHSFYSFLWRTLPCNFLGLSTKEAECISPSFIVGWLYDLLWPIA